MFENKYVRTGLIMAFSVAVVMLGVHEIRRSTAMRQSGPRFTDERLAAHLHNVSVIEKGRYTVKAFEQFQDERTEGESIAASRPAPSWKSIFKKF